MAPRTDGLAALRRWLDSTSTTQSELARRLGIRQPSVAAWLARDARPDALRREQLETVAGIPRAAWLTTDERAILAGRQS